MKAQAKTCRDCGKVLSRDEVALNKKLISPDVQEYLCLDCMLIARQQHRRPLGEQQRG